MPDDGDSENGNQPTRYVSWKCNWSGCSVSGSERSQIEADDAKVLHMAYCDKNPNWEK